MIAVVSLRATTESGLSIRFSLLVYTLLRRFRRANSSQIYAQTTVSRMEQTGFMSGRVLHP